MNWDFLKINISIYIISGIKTLIDKVTDEEKEKYNPEMEVRWERWR